jgi:hypothetical protein
MICILYFIFQIKIALRLVARSAEYEPYKKGGNTKEHEKADPSGSESLVTGVYLAMIS